MSDSVYKTFAGQGAFGSGEPDNDAAHIVKQYLRLGPVPMNSCGADVELWPLGKTQADIVVTKLRVNGSKAVTSASSDPEIDLVYDDGAGGADTVVGEFIDVSATAIVANTTREVVLSTPVTVPAGSTLYVRVDTNGTPADMGEGGQFLFEVEYYLAN